jgi:hypothetical protein
MKKSKLGLAGTKLSFETRSKFNLQIIKMS